MNGKLIFKNRFFALAVSFLVLFNCHACIAKEVAVPKEVMQEIERIVDAPSCFAGVDGMARKSRKSRIKDMVEWYNEYGIVNEEYNNWGLDIKNFRKQEDFLEYKVLCDERRQFHHGNINPKEYQPSYADKFEFYQTMKNNNLEDKTAKINYIVKEGKVVFPDDKQDMSALSALKSLKDGKYICKPRHGECGQGVRLIVKRNERLSFYDKYFKKASKDNFLESIYRKNYIIQDYVQQHKKLSALNDSSLNTLRIVTTRFSKDVHILGAMFRMGTGESIIDNAYTGGVCTSVNLKKGTLGKYGFYYSKFNKKVELKHPVSHIKYEDYQLPYWEETIKLVKKAHKVFCGLSSIGWDVAITEKGPIIMELNPGYSLTGFQAVNGGLKEKWYKLKKM